MLGVAWCDLAGGVEPLECPGLARIPGIAEAAGPVRLARHQLPPKAAVSPKPESAAILRRLSFPLRKSTLIALQAEDHYVRIHTEAGSELVLMRLSDAIAETSPLEGYRTHRSWWVAAKAVEQAQFKRGSGRVTLTGGLEAPISRSHVDNLREAGILS